MVMLVVAADVGLRDSSPWLPHAPHPVKIKLATAPDRRLGGPYSPLDTCAGSLYSKPSVMGIWPACAFPSAVGPTGIPFHARCNDARFRTDRSRPPDPQGPGRKRGAVARRGQHRAV